MVAPAEACHCNFTVALVPGSAAKPSGGNTGMLADIPLTAKMAALSEEPAPAGMVKVMEATGLANPKAARLRVV